MTLEWPTGWPRTPERNRKAGAFHYWGTEAFTPYGKTEKEYRKVKRDLTRAQAVRSVQEEVALMGGTGLRIDTGEDRRLDGAPRANQPRDLDSGAVVSFKLPGGRSIVFPCDKYTSIEQNLGAVAATLEAKRAIERHGVSTLDREFEGYKALPAGTPAGTRSPYDVLGLWPLASKDEVQAAYRAPAKERHPDRGGSHEAMQELNAARDALLEAA